MCPCIKDRKVQGDPERHGKGRVNTQEEKERRERKRKDKDTEGKGRARKGKERLKILKETSKEGSRPIKTGKRRDQDPQR